MDYLVKRQKTYLICKNNTKYETTYRVPFIVSQQKLNTSFIKLNNKIIQFKSELNKRSLNYMKTKDLRVAPEQVENAVNNVFKDVITKVSRRNIEALGKVHFSARIDFSSEGGFTVDPEKEKQLAKYYSRSDDPNSSHLLPNF